MTAFFISGGIIIQSFNQTTRFVTLIEVLVENRTYSDCPSAQMFLGLFFIYLFLKMPLQIMLVKRAIFEILIELKWNAISREDIILLSEATFGINRIESDDESTEKDWRIRTKAPFLPPAIS